MVTPPDFEILKTPKARKLRDKYKEVFGVMMIAFNYADFNWVGDKPAAQFYIEAMEKAIETGIPFESKYDPNEPLY